MDSLFCGKATAVAACPRHAAKSRLSNPPSIENRHPLTGTPIFWWRRVDSNHRSETQQIYSLPPLATRELLHIELLSPPKADPKSKPSAAVSIWKGDTAEGTSFRACTETSDPELVSTWSWWTDSNPRPADYKSAALPAELHQHMAAVQQQTLL